MHTHSSIKYLIVLLAGLSMLGCEGGIGGPTEPPCGDKLKNWDGDDAECSTCSVCPPKKRCLFDPATGFFTVIAQEDSTK